MIAALVDARSHLHCTSVFFSYSTREERTRALMHFFSNYKSLDCKTLYIVSSQSIVAHLPNEIDADEIRSVMENNFEKT